MYFRQKPTIFDKKQNHYTIYMLDTVRLAYSKAIESSTKTEEFAKILLAETTQSSTENIAENAIITAYKGALEALRAKHAWMPFNKLAYLDNAKKFFITAIEAAPNDIEIRFLRFSIQSNLPIFLMQSPNIQEDKEIIIKNLEQNNLDTRFVEVIASFVLKSGQCNGKETEFLISKIPQ